MEYYKAWFDNGLYIIEDLALKIIMQCRLSAEETENFRSELLFKQHNIIMTKEQSVLKSIKDAFEGENMQTQYNVLGYKIDLHFYDYKLAIEVDEKGDKDRDIHHETERQKATEKELDCKFIRINPDKENFNTFKAIHKIHRHLGT